MRKVLVCLAALSILLLSSSAMAAPVKFKFAHFINPIEPGPESGVWIEKDMKAKLAGKVDVKFFHSGQMGGAIEIVKKVRMGVLQGAYCTGNYAPELDAKFGIGTLAYCMDSYSKWEALLKNKPLRDELFNSLKDKGIVVLDLCFFGKYGLATTKPVTSLEDLKSMKMRTTQARYPLAFWKALGVNPVPMAWADVFPALKQGVVDGTDQTANVVRMRLTDVCKNFTVTNHMIGLFFFMVNKAWWEGMDPAVRNAMIPIIAENMAKARAKSRMLTKEAPAVLKKKGVKVINLPDSEMAKFKAAEMTVWKEFEGQIGKDWLDKIAAFTKTVKGE